MAITPNANTFNIYPSYDGVRYSVYPNGDKPNVGAASDWPANWPTITANVLVSDLPTLMTTADYYNIMGKRDLSWMQFRFPSAASKSDQASYLGNFKSLYPNSKLLQWRFPWYLDPNNTWSSTVEQPYHNGRMITDAAMGTDWYAYSVTGADYVFHDAGGVPASGFGYRPISSDAVTDGSGRSFSRALVEWDFQEFGSGVTQYWDGMGWDVYSLYPRQMVLGGPTGASWSFYDIDDDGVDEHHRVFGATGGLSEYWDEQLALAEHVRAVSGRSDMRFAANHGNTGIQYQLNAASLPNLDAHPWYRALEWPLMEWANYPLSLRINSTDDGYEVTNPGSGFTLFWLRTGIVCEMVKRTDNTTFEVIDFEVLRSAITSGLSANDRAYMRAFLCLCLLQERYCYAPNCGRDRPAPILDEELFYLGAPVSSRQMYSFPDTSDVSSVDVRAADSNGAHYAEFENGIVLFNSNAPSSGAWPQAATDTIDLPDPGAGRAWKYIDALTYTNPVTGYSMDGQESFNNGAAVTGGTYGQVSLKRWHGLMLERGYA